MYVEYEMRKSDKSADTQNGVRAILASCVSTFVFYLRERRQEFRILQHVIVPVIPLFLLPALLATGKDMQAPFSLPLAIELPQPFFKCCQELQIVACFRHTLQQRLHCLQSIMTTRLIGQGGKHTAHQYNSPQRLVVEQ
jgi:hypothetical protein